MARRKIPNQLVPDHLMAAPSAYDPADFAGKSVDQVLADMAETEKVAIAEAVITQIKRDGDPAALKLLQQVLERTNGEVKEIPIKDERFREIIKVVAATFK